MHTPSVLVLDLDRPRDLGGILATTFTLYGRHFLVFATIAFGVAIPVDLLVYGVAAEQLWSDHDDSPGVGAAVLEFLAPILITTPLITAGHVHAVMEIGTGRTPRAGGSLRAALNRLPSVAGATVLFSIAAALGTLALILPGIYVWVRFAFSAQAVMAEDLGAREALARSWELVEDGWWRVFGILLLVTVIAGAVAAVIAVPLELAASETNTAQLSLVGTIVLDAVTLSFTALAGTLLYFDVRVRRRSAPVE